jgi:hypothetical protein
MKLLDSKKTPVLALLSASICFLDFDDPHYGTPYDNFVC